MATDAHEHSERILAWCRGGDPRGFDLLFDLWHQPLYYYLRRLCHDDAEDLSQATWERILSSLHRVKDPNKLPAWLYRVAHHTALMHLRSRRATEELVEEVHVDPGLDAGELVFRAEEAAQIHAALAKLPRKDREVLALHFIEEFPLAEIADILGIPEGTVKSRLHYAKQALRTILRREARQDG